MAFTEKEKKYLKNVSKYDDAEISRLEGSDKEKEWHDYIKRRMRRESGARKFGVGGLISWLLVIISFFVVIPFVAGMFQSGLIDWTRIGFWIGLGIALVMLFLALVRLS